MLTHGRDNAGNSPWVPARPLCRSSLSSTPNLKQTRPKMTYFNRVCSLLRLRPFDVSTKEGRSQERYRRVLLTALSSAAARGTRVLTILVSVPLTLGYLGEERYGLWMTISSVIALLGFADLGIGNGLLNEIADAHGKDDREAARRAVSSAFFMLLGITLALAGGLAVVYPFVPWPRVFNVSSAAASAEAGPAVAVFAACFLVNIPLATASKVRMGFQEGYVDSLWQGAGNLVGLAGVIMVVYLKLGLPWLVFAMAGPPAAANLINSLVLYGINRPWLRPRVHGIEKTAALRILRLGAMFFALQLAIAVGYQSDNIIIAHILGPDQVARYDVPLKLFTIAPMFMGFFLAPLWPAFGEAIARRDIAWVHKALFQAIAGSFLLTIPVAVVLLIWGVPIAHFWVGPRVTPSLALRLGFAVWILQNCLNGPFAMFLNGANALRFQVACATLMGLSNLALSIILVKAIGLPGAIYSTVCAFALFRVIPSAFYIRRWFLSMQHSTG